ncbi:MULTISPECIES: lysophospholipid acyltransferase family protein [unclassified Adlercreutzia]|uniref:lysophospholipid acyltransferase family protein n=1 Tax=unclassified Adlercreutzia TaxID=2636013 RepID=UPI0013ECC587|nr:MULTISPECIES: lysophospholipid acyltransferase family protein [unclassified Adlercreutzia]
MAAAYEKLWDMPLDKRAARIAGERGIPLWFAYLVCAVVGTVFRIAFRMQVTGLEHIRGFEGKRGAVVIGNHVSYLDVVFMFLAVRPKQWLRMVARDDLFVKGGGALGWAMSHVGAFPVKRDTADRSAVKRAARMVKSGELVGIMPEGTRRGKSGKTPELHAGVALIAKMGRAPIVPMTVRDVENIKRHGQHLRFPKVTIEFGNPILVSDFDFLPKEDRLDACTWYAMREVFALNRRVAPEEVDMRELFPDARDFSEVFLQHSVPRHTACELASGHDVWAEA